MSEKLLKKVDNKEGSAHKVKYYGTGRRKSSVARVWILQGKGNISVNDKPVNDYIVREMLAENLKLPLKITNNMNSYDVIAFVKGGGMAGQAGAIRHGITRALLTVNPDFRKMLKREGLVTRDPREKEPKKYGRKKARKGFQYRKR
ncbi:MAG: 30S ribosomal protein S9 [Candidatus Margulisiibacteriota bacterium]|nr:MAG: 30S ribosomal protein S9 [Candidatus Margulisbacteria bacterium GWD2_39_127]OGI04616.1 MAG: 30S ribosomal protein S9 [Candidatus Margulisbacteria bacterium GWF2_38_17]OGI11852.1 MAG: 30S ribosomal protein S9 [Candidatus Margulisbacteria bacterium GWE2_39_32]PZM79773.1 MAG: 30S ribosomal protein S9 [Candidatus Margulisiibacteriota bacterium]HAR62678.1 30S ribosomal protein S9 [Candidatus Margulisiibacteriota bacterium]